MRILFTGSRHWNNAAPVAAIINSLPDHAIVIHGAARGLDSLAGSLAEQRGLTVEAHPADWSLHGRAAGPIRNAYMASLGAHVCYAFPLKGSKGTRHMVTHARGLNIPVFIHDFR
tara:strand:+ start:3848 stop:4192 length:345 start_codon:yes stop_codon:yes gene_type:complete